MAATDSPWFINEPGAQSRWGVLPIGDDSLESEHEWTGTHRTELVQAEKLLDAMKTTID